MPRTEVYQLRLTKAEKDELAARAREQRISMAKLIRQRLNLDASSRITQVEEPAMVSPPYTRHPDSGPGREWGTSQVEPANQESRVATLAKHFFARGMTSRQARLEAERKIDG